MTNIASKNLYDLLGNDPELDPDREPEPPTKVIDKPVQRSGKRNTGADGPPSDTPRPVGGGRGGRPQTFTRGDQAGSLNNRAEQRDDGLRQDRHSDRNREPREHRGGTDRGGRGRGRGRGDGEGRGGRGYGGRFQRTNRDDRQNHSGIGEHEKQAAHGWGEEKDGQAEWNDEKAGDAIAQAETKDEPGFTPDTGAADPAFSNGPATAEEPVAAEAVTAEPEDNTKSYDQYLAEQAEKRLALSGNSLETRKANEGSKQEFPEGTAVAREEQNFFIGGGGKKQRERTHAAKERVQLDGQYYAPAESGERGGRGRGGRGGRGRGEFRGDRGGDRGDRLDRGDRPERGDREERGGRGGRGRGRGDRGDFRGGFRGDRGERGGSRGGFNANDSSAFPALGGS